MIWSPDCRVLLAQRSFHPKRVAHDDDQALFAVRIVGHDGGVYGYRWQVNKVSEGAFSGTWLTTSVRLGTRLSDAV
jgi:hypothetical protein